MRTVDAVVPVAVELLAGVAARGGTVVLSGHVQPDADALGSTLALAEGLRRLGARVVATFPEPFVLPQSLGWLPGADRIVHPGALPADVDLFVSLDVASPGRLGALAGLLEIADRSIVVDHHASNPGFGEVRIVDPHAAATVVLVAVLLEGLRTELVEHLATCLYAG